MTESIEPSGVGASPASSETVQHLAPPPSKPVKNVHDWLRDLRMSADVNQTTVGVASDRVTPELMLATANKLLGISRREVEPDPKDSLQFQRVYGPNEYFSEHILRDAGRLGRQLLWKATNRGNLDFMQTAALDGHVSDVFNSSRLANMIDGSSPLETVDAAFKVTRIGEGGVGDVSSAPDEMRLVQPSFLGYVDSVRSPECCSKNHEIKTLHGWKPISEVTTDDKVACLIDGRLEYHQPEQVVSYEYNGDLYCFENKKIAYELTGNHRVWCRKQPHKGCRKKSGGWQKEHVTAYGFEYAECMHNTTRLFMPGGHLPLKHAERTCVVIESDEDNHFFDIGDWCEFLGWYISEGSVLHTDKYQRAVTISQVERMNTENCAMIGSLLARMRLRYRFNGRAFCMASKALWTALEPLGYCDDKYIPDEVFEAPEKAQWRFIDALLRGDGRKEASGLPVLCTTSKRLADDYERLLFNLGKAVSVKFEKDDREERYLGCYTIRCLQSDELWLCKNGHKITEREARSDYYRMKPYKGKVYCVTVPGGLFYTRIPGHVGFWTGNSLKVGLDTYLTKYCMKGSDGKLYQKFINARTGKPELVDSVTAAKSVVTTPDMMKAKTNYIYALGGKTGVRIVPRKDVDYYLPKMDQAFSTAANLVTGLSGVKEMRLLMGCLHPLATLVTIGKDNMVTIGYAKDVSSDSGSVPGTDNGAMTVCRHRIRATLAKFPPGRAWFRKIVLYSGRALTTSKDHRWAVLRDGKVELVDAVKLKPGDKIFRRMFDDYQGRRTFVLGVQVDSALAELLGYMTRNGSMPAKDTVRVPYAPKHRMDIENALCRLRLRTVTYHGSKAEPVLSIHDRAFAEWFAANIGQSADVRRVPSVVLSAKPTIVASFLDAYTSDDTKVAQDSQDYTWILDIGNFVERDGIALLLSRLGTDTYYRDAYQGGGETQLALKLTEGTAKHGALLLDAVKANLPVQGAAIMIDVDADDNLYASASGIVTHNSKYPLQAISIEGREAPYVRNIDSETGKDIHSAIGKYLGARFAQKPGVVTAVRQNRIDVQYDDGTKGHVALYNNFPMNAKGYITNTAQVKAGDKFGKGDLLASSNYTDDKGVMATGTNLRVGWLSWKGGTYEDAVVLSESAARKLTGSVMYASSLDLDKTVTLGKRNYRSWKPGEYTKEQLSVLNDDGIVMPGTILHKGDPMVLAVRTTEPSPGTMGKRVLTDVSQVWEHDNPGKVTDVVRTRGGVKVLATVTTPVEVGDKVSGLYGNKGVCSMILPDDQMPVDKDGKPLDMILSPLGLVSRCYDDQTEFLTRNGWKLGKDVADEDLLYCYDPSDNTWRWDRQITPMHKFQYKGTMYGGRNRLVDFLVSPGHKVWTKSDYPKAPWKQTTIDDIFGKRYYIPCVASAPKTEPQATDFHLPLIQIKAKDTCTTSDAIVYNAGDWAEFLGWYLSEGNTTYDEQSREYRVNISQSAKAKPDNVRHLHELLTRMGFTYHYTAANTQFHIGGKRLAAYMKQFGKCHEKFTPDWLFQQPTYILRRFLDGLWAGDGREAFFPNNYGKVVHVRTIGLTSERLIDQVQMLLAMCGESAQKHTAAVKHPGKDKPMWRLGVSTVGRTCRLLRDDDWYSIDNYDGMLYCPSVPSGYIMTRRNGKTICMGNCNPTQLTETLLGKIAHKTGKTELIDAFPENDIHQYVLDKLKQNQLNAEDDFYDPETGRRIQGVVNGYSYIHRLKHMAESKESARGTDAYSTDETPGGSGYAGSKRFGTLEQSAMAGHAAFDNLLDNKLIRGQSNADFWRSIRTGGIPTIPGEPLVQKKFFAHLQGSGVNVRKTPKGISVFALSNSDVEKLAGPRELKSRDTYEARTFRPIDGGLFGQDVFGQNGDQWGYIQLDEPVPNPVMEEPLARLLRMSVKDFTAAATGAAEVNGIRGPVQLKEALSKINLEQESKQAMQEFKDAPASKRDNALKRYVAVENMRRAGLSPAEYMLDRIPVLPAQFRPVTSHNGLTMVADANYLYAQLLDARDDLRDSRDLPQEYQDKARENLYRTWQELTGLYDPEDVKLRNKNVGGLLKWALGTSPKFSAFQRKVLGGSVDTVGRGAIIPNSKLTVDQIGIPIGMAFDIMAPFVERGLVKRGYTPVDAMKMVKKHDKQAEDVLREVVKTHPVEMNRAPTLHKFNIMAFEPVLVQGHAIQVHPSVCPGFGADFDGDTVNVHVPVSDNARREAMERMRPSRNLIAPSDRKIMYKPEKEYMQGLFFATRLGQSANGRVPIFRTKAEAEEAYEHDIINVDTPIRILELEQKQ